MPAQPFTASSIDWNGKHIGPILAWKLEPRGDN